MKQKIPLSKKILAGFVIATFIGIIVGISWSIESGNWPILIIGLPLMIMIWILILGAISGIKVANKLDQIGTIISREAK